MIKKAAELVAEAKRELDCVDAATARHLVESDGRTLVLDVREPAEVEASAVRGAINIPRGLLEMKVEEAVPEHDRPLLVCCASGGRAALSARTLRHMGYTDVRVIDCAHGDIAEAFNR